MVKGMYEKTMRPADTKKGGKTPEQSYSQGSKLTKTPKPKSLTPAPRKGK